jgi:hypothetical protein
LPTLCLTLLAAAGCGDGQRIVDSFPILASSSSGVMLLSASLGGGAAFPMLVDTAAAVTAIDQGEAPARGTVELRLLGAQDPNHVTRAVFYDLPVLLAPLGPIGVGQAFPVGGVLGGDVLSSYAVRLTFTAPGNGGFAELQLFPDEPAGSSELSRVGLAVFRTPLAGAAAYLIGSESVSLDPALVTVDACIDPDPASVAAGLESGADSTLLLGTGSSPLVLGEQAFARLKPGTAPGEATQLYYVGGTAPARRASLARVLVVSDEDSSLGACAELARACRIAGQRTPAICGASDLGRRDPTADDDGKNTAAVAQVAGPTEAVVIADETPLLQGLRFQLRPDRPEIDGTLGVDFLRRFVTEIDYPGGRLILSCLGEAAGSGECAVQPWQEAP